MRPRRARASVDAVTDVLPADPTGRQHHLSRGTVTAQIAQVGASLRSLVVGGVDIVPPYPAGSRTPFGSGIVLVPWPNRIRDGLWHRDGAPEQLAITEPARNNAIHGLLRYAPYEVAAEAPDAITLAATVYPQGGYPFLLDTSVTYALTDDGVTVTHRIRNTGTDAAPVAIGTHPFLTIGDVDPESLVLTVPGATRFPVDDRLLPSPEVSVEGTPLDLRGGRPVAELDLDDAFGDILRDADGVARCTLVAPDGRTVTMWSGEGFDYVQVFTTDAYPGQKKAIAVEPMTAPADAFNSGLGVRVLEPGEYWTASWGITYTV